MPKRISRSQLDPLLSRPLKALYARLSTPAWLPPEAIVAAVGFVALDGVYYHQEPSHEHK